MHFVIHRICEKPTKQEYGSLVCYHAHALVPPPPAGLRTLLSCAHMWAPPPHTCTPCTLQIEFPNPNEAARLDILRIHSRKMNLTRGIDLKKIADKMSGVCVGGGVRM
jgi:hypothetical protein